MPFLIRTAGLLCRVENRHDLLRRRFADYLADEDAPADLSVRVSDEMISAYIEWSRTTTPDISVSEAAAEYACFPLALAPLLPAFGALLLHATVVEYRGSAYAFTAPSGYGKTTHARLWLKAFGSEARIINGDHPILREQGGIFHAYGTPFCGKEGYNVNTGAPLRGICYLTRSETNRLRRMSPSMALAQLFADGCFTSSGMDTHLDVLTRLVESVPVYQLFCNQEADAARTALEGMQQAVVPTPDRCIPL